LEPQLYTQNETLTENINKNFNEMLRMKRKKQILVLGFCIVLLLVISGTASAAIIFADKVDHRTGRSPTGIYAADFDGDGDKDVVNNRD
jgi:hypothetical protein